MSILETTIDSIAGLLKNGDYKFSIIVTDITTGVSLEIAKVATSMSLSSYRNGSASVFKFQIILPEKEQLMFCTGASVAFLIDGKTQFLGVVFTISRDRWNLYDVTCYDYLRYLKNQVYVFRDKGVPAKELINDAVEKCGLKLDMNIEVEYSWKNLEFIHYEKTALDLINWILGRVVVTSMKANKLTEGIVVIRSSIEKPKTVEIVYANKNGKDVIISDKSLLTDFTIMEDINSKTYTKVWLTYDEGIENGKKAARIWNNPVALARYGTLTLVKDIPDKSFAKIVGTETNESVDVAGESAALELDQIASRMVQYYSKPSFTLDFSALGVVGLRAGDYIPIDIKGVNIGNVPVRSGYKFIIIDEITHQFKEGAHTMDIRATVAITDVTLEASVPVKE